MVVAEQNRGESAGLDDPGERLPRGCSVLEAGDSGGGTAERVESVYPRKTAAGEGRRRGVERWRSRNNRIPSLAAGGLSRWSSGTRISLMKRKKATSSSMTRAGD